MVELCCLPYYLPIVGVRIIGFVPFSMVLALCEMQTSNPGYELVASYQLHYECLHICMYVSNSFATSRMPHKVIFMQNTTRSEFRVFLLLDQFP